MAHSKGTEHGADVRPLSSWLSRMRDRVRPTYVDYVPEEPRSPYRARLNLLPDQSPDGVEISEREVVRGAVALVYETRCACGKRWFSPRFQRLQLCPRCGRAVLLEPPT